MFDDWRIRRYPELGQCDSLADRKAVFNAALNRVTKPLTGRIALAMGFAGGIAAVGLDCVVWPTIHWAMPDWFGPKPNGLMMMPLMLSIVIVLHRLFIAPRIQMAVRHELIERGHRICLQCGYDLTGHSSGVCPECGEPVAGAAEKTGR